MIKGNRIEFGFGDVLVGFNILGINFTNIKPPIEVGTRIKDTGLGLEHFEIGKQITIPLHGFGELEELRKLVSSVTEEKPAFAYKEYVFDFSNYNRKSVNVVLNHLDKPNPLWLMALAC